MAGELKHQDLNNGVVPDDPSAFLTPTKWDKPLRLGGGTDHQLVERSTALDGTTGMNLTSRPSVEAVVFPLTAPGTPANGSFWVEDDGTAVKMWIKRANGDLLSVVLG